MILDQILRPGLVVLCILSCISGGMVQGAQPQGSSLPVAAGPQTDAYVSNDKFFACLPWTDIRQSDLGWRTVPRESMDSWFDSEYQRTARKDEVASPMYDNCFVEAGLSDYGKQETVSQISPFNSLSAWFDYNRTSLGGTNSGGQTVWEEWVGGPKVITWDSDWQWLCETWLGCGEQRGSGSDWDTRGTELEAGSSAGRRILSQNGFVECGIWGEINKVAGSGAGCDCLFKYSTDSLPRLTFSSSLFGSKYQNQDLSMGQSVLLAMNVDYLVPWVEVDEYYLGVFKDDDPALKAGIDICFSPRLTSWLFWQHVTFEPGHMAEEMAGLGASCHF